MSSHAHARKNAARYHQDVFGLNRRAALQGIRDSLPAAPGARRAAPAAGPADDVVPEQLLALVEDHCRRGSGYLREAVRLGHQQPERMHDWQRLVLYALTDALAHNFLLVGALAAYLQQRGVDDDLLRRYLQSPEPDRYVTQDALDHLAGLLGQPAPAGQPEPVWYIVGRQISDRQQQQC